MLNLRAQNIPDMHLGGICFMNHHTVSSSGTHKTGYYFTKIDNEWFTTWRGNYMRRSEAGFRNGGGGGRTRMPSYCPIIRYASF